MSVPIKELGSKLSYQEVNEIISLFASQEDLTLPQYTKYTGQIWLDTRDGGAILKRYNGSSWENISDVTQATLLTAIKAVDGPGSGIDADTLDGLQAGSFIRADAADSVAADITWSDNKKIRMGSSGDMELYSDDTDVYLDFKRTNGRLIFKLSGTGQAAEVQSALTGSAGAFSNHPILRLRQTANTTYNINDIHSEIQFYTDDPESAVFPGTQAYIRALTTRADGVSYPDAGLSLGVTDGTNAPSESMRLEGDGNIKIPQDKSLFIGASNDLELAHSGTYTIIRNAVDNGKDFYIQNQSHGEKIIMTCENSAGAQKVLMTLDPQTDRVVTKLSSDSLPDLWEDVNSGFKDNPFICSGSQNFAERSTGTTVLFPAVYASAPRVVITAEYNASSSALMYVKAISTSGFTAAHGGGTGTMKANWIAIGKRQ